MLPSSPPRETVTVAWVAAAVATAKEAMVGEEPGE